MELKKKIYYTALHFACKQGYNEIAKLLLSTPNIDINATSIFQNQFF